MTRPARFAKTETALRAQIAEAMETAGCIRGAAGVIGVTPLALRRKMIGLGLLHAEIPAGLSGRPRADHSKPRATEVVVPPATGAAWLMATQGKYAALAEWGQRHGLTATQALQRWHNRFAGREAQE